MEQCLNMTTINQSWMCPNYCRTDGWHETVFCLNEGGNIKPMFYHAECWCKFCLFAAQTHTHKHTRTHAHTHTAAAPCWRNGGVHGRMFTDWTRKLQVAELWAEEVSPSDLVFISRVRSSWLLFHKSTASTSLLWKLRLLHREPKHKQIINIHCSRNLCNESLWGRGGLGLGSRTSLNLP